MKPKSSEEELISVPKFLGLPTALRSFNTTSKISSPPKPGCPVEEK